jgi:hypothetical protein
MTTIGILFAVAIAAFIGGYWYGRYAQKEKDKPVLILREDQEGHALLHPHHVHPHDQKK